MSTTTGEIKNWFTFIWLDVEIHKNEHNQQLQDKLRSTTQAFKPFEDVKSCERFIHSVSPNHHIVLIASGRFSQEIVPNIHSLSQVSVIYVYCMKKEYMEEWAKQYNKVKYFISFVN